MYVTSSFHFWSIKKDLAKKTKIIFTIVTGAGTGKKKHHTYKTERDKDNMEAQGRKTMSYFSTVFQIIPAICYATCF